MPPVEFEPTTPAGERPQTNALDRGTTGTDPEKFYNTYFADALLRKLERELLK